MPKRVIDFDALWASDKIASCPGWVQAEYAWLYGLADASGSFELTNLRVIWGRVAAIRKELTIERLEEVFQEFMARGLLFTWQAGGKRYGHWTGSDVPGRLPPPSWRARLERLAPALPKQELAAYMSRFSSRREPVFGDEVAAPAAAECARKYSAAEAGPEDEVTAPGGAQRNAKDSARLSQLNLGLEEAQGQEWDWNKDWKKEKERTHTPVCVPLSCISDETIAAPLDEQKAVDRVDRGTSCAQEWLEIYEVERGGLPAAAGLTAERRKQCRQRNRSGVSREAFANAVRRAAATPFLLGEGARGWRASFDWLIANDTNIRKVLAGAYDAVETRGASNGGLSMRPMDRALYSEIHVGAGPVAAESGARVRPEAMERIRAREAGRRPP